MSDPQVDRHRARWRWRRRRNQAFGFWENREGERVGPIPLDEQGRPAFVPATDCRGAVSQDVIRSALDEAATHPGIGDVAAAILFLRGRLNSPGGQ